MNKKGFVFVETIIVTCVLLASLMVVYSLYVSSLNSETRQLRYDDPARLYQTYYLEKYFNSFDMDLLLNRISSGTSKYELIYQGRSDIFGSSYSEEALFFDSLWNHLHIKNIYLVKSNVSELAKCKEKGYEVICSNQNLVSYLRNLDDGEANTFYFIVEYATSRSGGNCTNIDCFSYFSYMTMEA